LSGQAEDTAAAGKADCALEDQMVGPHLASDAGSVVINQAWWMMGEEMPGRKAL
jgi:hypothetical protein